MKLILFAQEVKNTEVLQMQGYTSYCNIGTTMRGTAILAREGLHLENVAAAPTGRAIVATFRGLLLLNIYAPSETSKKGERDQLFNLELPTLLRTDYTHVVCGGDFNCVLHHTDVQCHYYKSRTLEELIHGFNLRDAWTVNSLRPTYTFYYAAGATRIDRFYLPSDWYCRKSGTRNLPVAFTDQCAVVTSIFTRV
jgi:exonuclease III